MHRAPEPDREDAGIIYSSEYVKHALVDKLRDKTEADITKLLAKSKKDDLLLGSLRGALYERYSHMKLVKGGTFTLQSLGSYSSPVLGSPTSVRLPSLTLKQFDKVLSALPGLLARNDYAKPRQRTYEALDAVAIWSSKVFGLPGPAQDVVVGFQMTISAAHPIKGNGLANALQGARAKLGQPNAPLVIVLVTDNDSLKTPQSIVGYNNIPYVSPNNAHLSLPQFALRLEVVVGRAAQ